MKILWVGVSVLVPWLPPDGSSSAGHCCCSQGRQTCADWGQEICAPSPTVSTRCVNVHIHITRSDKLIKSYRCVIVHHNIGGGAMWDTECKWEWKGGEWGIYLHNTENMVGICQMREVGTHRFKWETKPNQEGVWKHMLEQILTHNCQ